MKIATIERKQTWINVMPLIDVVFLLLLFFMLTTSFKHEKIMQITLPEATNTIKQQDEVFINLYINKAGKVLLAGMPLSLDDRRELYLNLSELKSDNMQPVVISADKDTPYKFVITMMDALAEVGFSQIKLQTQDVN